MLIRIIFFIFLLPICCKSKSYCIHSSDYVKIDSICYKLGIENDTFKYNFKETPIFILNKSRSIDSVFCEYPIKHLIQISNDDSQNLKTSLNKVEENEIWVFKQGVVLFIQNAKSNMFSIKYTIFSTKSNMQLFESFGHKIKLIESCNNNWVKFTWESYIE